MKKIIILFCLMPMITVAEEVPLAIISSPETSCPSGYVAIIETHMVVADYSCPANYTSAGTADSCLVSEQSGTCMMYAPIGVTYSDESGVYSYGSVCPLI